MIMVKTETMEQEYQSGWENPASSFVTYYRMVAAISARGLRTDFSRVT